MAETKKVTLKRFNGTDYDTIRPETEWDQVQSKPTTFTPTAHTLNSHTDVNASPTDGQVLTWDDTNSIWIAGDGVDLSNYYDKTEIDGKFTTVATTIHTQTEQIKSLPAGTKDSGINDIDINGLTLVNSVENGDFSNGTTGWTFGSAITNVSVSNGQLLFTGAGSITGSGVRWVRNTNSKIKIGNQYFIAFDAKRTNTLTTNVIQVGWNFYNVTAFTLTETMTKYGLIKTGSDFDDLLLTFGAVDSGLNVVMDNVFFIDMTALGIESYTEAQMLELVRNGYFDGIQSGTPQVTTVGKNLFDHRADLYQSFATRTIEKDGLLVSANTTFSSISYLVKVKPSTTYAFSTFTELVSGSFNPLIAFERLDYSKFTNDLTGTGQLSRSFTTGSNDHELYIRFYGTVTDTSGSKRFSNIQLELGSSATTYEPYKSSTLTHNAPLRRVPNGVADRLYETNGQYFYEKRVEEKVIQAGNAIFVRNTPTHAIYGVLKSSDYIHYGRLSTVSGTMHFGSRIESPVNNSSLLLDNQYTNGTSNYYTEFTLPLGTTLEQAQTAIAGTVIQYQLTTPQIINLTQGGDFTANGELLSYANGQMQVDGIYGGLTASISTNQAAQNAEAWKSIDSLSKDLKTKSDVGHTHTASDIDSETATDGYVLTADGSGNATWAEASGGGGGTPYRSIKNFTGTIALTATTASSGITIPVTESVLGKILIIYLNRIVVSYGFVMNYFSRTLIGKVDNLADPNPGDFSFEKVVGQLTGGYAESSSPSGTNGLMVAKVENVTDSSMLVKFTENGSIINLPTNVYIHDIFVM